MRGVARGTIFPSNVISLSEINHYDSIEQEKSKNFISTNYNKPRLSLNDNLVELSY